MEPRLSAYNEKTFEIEYHSCYRFAKSVQLPGMPTTLVFKSSLANKLFWPIDYLKNYLSPNYNIDNRNNNEIMQDL
jgi:hypothetical protein